MAKRTISKLEATEERRRELIAIAARLLEALGAVIRTARDGQDELGRENGCMSRSNIRAKCTFRPPILCAKEGSDEWPPVHRCMCP